ncbi:hypothetical protein GTZ85_03250 [Streptomyces sp. SID5474]|nr:hypothetical protein [Streptomyces sp. SID5474]
MKDPATVVGPDDPVLIPRGSVRTDGEVELAVVVARRVRHLDSPTQAAAHAAGYTIGNDVSRREFQLACAGQVGLRQVLRDLRPAGPLARHPDEIPDPQDLRMTTTVDGVPRRDGTTADMILDATHPMYHLSRHRRGQPGRPAASGARRQRARRRAHHSRRTAAPTPVAPPREAGRRTGSRRRHRPIRWPRGRLDDRHRAGRRRRHGRRPRPAAGSDPKTPGRIGHPSPERSGRVPARSVREPVRSTPLGRTAGTITEPSLGADPATGQPVPRHRHHDRRPGAARELRRGTGAWAEGRMWNRRDTTAPRQARPVRVHTPPGAHGGVDPVPAADPV